MAKTLCILLFIALILLAWPAGVAAQLSGQEDASGAPCPAEKPKLIVAGRAAPSEKEYLALVAREKQKISRDMSAQGIRTLERALIAAPRAAAGADLGLLFLSINDVSAAVYATAISAWRDPADALTANNLGAALKVARAYDSAFSVLLYANARLHDSPVILTNLGNVAFALGDGKAAGEFYRQALAASPDHPAALTGLGHLALCRGDKAGAARCFRKAMDQMYLPAARAGLEKTRGGGDNEEGNAKPGSARVQPDEAQNKPISHPSGKGGGKGISLPDPPVSSSARGMALRLDDIGRLAEDGQKQLADLGRQIAAASSAMAGTGGAGSSPSGARIVLRNSNEKEIFVLDDTWRIFDARIWERTDRLLGKITDLMIRTQDRQMAILQQESAEIAACGGNDACFRAAELKACRAYHALAMEAHAQFFPIWQDLWQGTHTDLSDYHTFTTPWLQDIHDVQANRFYNITRQMYVLGQATSLYCIAQSEAGLMAQLTERDCTAFEEKREVWVPRPLKEWPDDPMKCRSGTMSMKLIIATLEGDCDKLSVEFGSGVFVSGEYRWGSTGSEDQVTLWGGLGQTVGVGPVSVSGKIGPYVTFQLSGDSSKLVDYGVKDEAGLSVELGPARVDAAAEARLGAETGLNVDYSATPKLGAEI